MRRRWGVGPWLWSSSEPDESASEFEGGGSFRLLVGFGSFYGVGLGLRRGVCG